MWKVAPPVHLWNVPTIPNLLPVTEQANCLKHSSSQSIHNEYLIKPPPSKSCPCALNVNWRKPSRFPLALVLFGVIISNNTNIYNGQIINTSTSLPPTPSSEPIMSNPALAVIGLSLCVQSLIWPSVFENAMSGQTVPCICYLLFHVSSVLLTNASSGENWCGVTQTQPKCFYTN